MKKFAVMACMLSMLASGCSNAVLPTDPAADAAPTANAQALQPGRPAKQGGSVTQVRTDGTLLVNGQANFPMGFYHVSWAGDSARRLRDLQAIADLGFNTVHASMLGADTDVESFRQLLDTAQKRGVRLVAEDHSDQAIVALKSHPALLGWLVSDDCHNLVTPSELQSRGEQIKRLDPNHLTYTSMAIPFYNSYAYRDYFGRVDAIGNQSYPVDGGDGLDVVFPVMSKLVEQSKAKGTMPIANLQSFRWPNGRYPTPVELNSMTNQALAAGVKGILYYTYLDYTNDLSQHSQLHAELKTLASEVKVLAPFLTNGQRQALPVVSTGGRALAHLWSYGGRRYLQVVSLEAQAAQNVKIQLPAKARGLRPLFAGRTTTLQASGAQVQGRLAPLGAQWYEVQ